MVMYVTDRVDGFTEKEISDLNHSDCRCLPTRVTSAALPAIFSPPISGRTLARKFRPGKSGHCAVKLITRTRDPFERSISACEQLSSSMSATSISVVGRHCKVLGISPGQMRHAEPSLSSTRWLLSCLLICIADLPYNRSEHTNPTTS